MTSTEDGNAMRWSGQRTDRVDDGALPGLARLSGFVRSVRTPEFRGVTFHEVLAKSALNHVPADARMLAGEYTINPYRGCTHACQYCFARPTHTRLGLDVAGDFDNEIIVKTNIAEVLRSELARKRKLPPRVAFGTNTDVYQRAEGRYELMPGIIDALTAYRVPFSVLTKGPLIRRDLDRLAKASRTMTVHLGVSLSILDEGLQQSVEFGTATTSARLATVRAIRDAGLDCTVFLSPILPRLTDSDEKLRELVAAVAAAGATAVLFHPLYLSSGVKDVFFTWLRRAHPELVGDYTTLYSSGSETLRPYRHELSDRIRAIIAHHGFPEPDESIEDRFALNGRRTAPAPEPPQPTLF
ncbi:radical SAM protein [Amycolatopsis australiensis]|uniref:DNA repair photolyase n=1 Tax=Amycolatopsis australiensis TaxID=546364 RepID=A0A1K1T3E0_9PSEU|nr:radical SAM protein [Amycolatopsis australiensis]SFW91091.1 DNA repair photolyase [Amycolatopsis australiensis]